MRMLTLILLWLLPSGALANDELITVQSAHSAAVRNILGRHEAKGVEGDVRMLDAKVAAMIDNVTR
jgi:hypothetical protein